MMWGIKKTLILIALLTLNTYAYAAPTIQNSTQGTAHDPTMDPNLRILGNMPESAPLLILGAGLLIIAIYARKIFGKRTL
ncbi:MAG: hypothetical protein WA240_15000 [Nitrospirota bacterium]